MQEKSILIHKEDFIRHTIQLHFGEAAAKCPLLPLKEGMTNDSFLFVVGGQKYIFRCNGQGTELLIDRENEKSVYEILCAADITERVIALNIKPGYKISYYYEGARVCNPKNMNEAVRCMRALRSFHEQRLTAGKRFNPFEAICNYEKLILEKEEICPAYTEVKAAVFSLQPYLTPFLENADFLCHIDSISDNFLFVDGRETPYLIDWEYAGLSDPLIDIAMFAIYANYTEEATNCLITGYFPEGFDDQIRARVYAYMALGGLLWSLWCRYKSLLGTVFGVYEENQFRFAKEYPAKVQALLGGEL
jgi:cholinephosphate cytidylyltransferase/choline kinase